MLLTLNFLFIFIPEIFFSIFIIYILILAVFLEKQLFSSFFLNWIITRLLFKFFIFLIFMSIFQLNFFLMAGYTFNSFCNSSCFFFLDLFFVFFRILIYLFTFFFCLFIWKVYPSFKYYIELKYEIFFLTSFLGLSQIFIVISKSLLSLFLSIELFSFGVYFFIAYACSLCNLEISLKYFFYGVLSSCFFLFGSLLFYVLGGSLIFSDIGLLFISYKYKFFDEGINFFMKQFFFIGSFFLFSSFFLKLGFFPFHIWLLDFYRNIDNISFAYFIFLGKLSFFFIIFRFYLMNFFFTWADNKVFFSFFLLFVFSLFIGVIGAFNCFSIKEIFAFGSLGQMSLVLISFHTTGIGLFFGLMFFIFYSCIIFLSFLFFQKFFGFFSLGSLSLLKGCYQSFPSSCWLCIISIFSLAGLPPFLGFFIKLPLFLNFMNNFYLFFSFFFLLSSWIAYFYYLRIVKFFFFKKTNIYYFFNSFSFFFSFFLFFLTSFQFIFFFL